MKKLIFVFIAVLVIGFISCNKDDVTPIEFTTNPTPTDEAFVKTIEFPSGDSSMITADHFHVNNSKPIIVLCHQAGYSRGEYLEIADSLNRLGFNCLAIDQRSGGSVNGVNNETRTRAIAAGLAISFTDAKQDIVAAISWAKAYYGKNVILWGSSYSAAHSLVISNENADVEQVLVFSPGEFLAGTNVEASVTGLNKPAFLTSSKTEATDVTDFYNVITSTDKVQFIPTGSGVHGAKALWSSQSDQAEYWVAVKAFLGV